MSTNTSWIHTGRHKRKAGPEPHSYETTGIDGGPLPSTPVPSQDLQPLQSFCIGLCGHETEHSLHFLTIGSVRKVYCGDSLQCQERLRITSANCSSCVFKVLSNASIQRSEYQSMRLPLAEPGNLSSTKLPISFSFHHS